MVTLEEASSSHNMQDGSDDDGVVETDPDGRFLRYKEMVGKGRFKQVFKSFDTTIGIDVAWSKINADSNHLTPEQIMAVVRDIQKGLHLEHPNIIKCFKCWEDSSTHCINLITELFTSGNLRQYRNLHKHLDRKAVKRMAKQILKGLEYLHSMDPPVTHGDLRCDKIYVNGHLGEIKIGDLGLATLMPYRWEGAEQEQTPPQPPVMSPADDVFAFGLCMLELLTLKQLDPQHCSDLPELLASLPDDDSRAFIATCLSDQRPSARVMIEDPYLLMVRKQVPPPAGAEGGAAAGGGAGAGNAGTETAPGQRSSSDAGGGGLGGGGGGGGDRIANRRTLHEAIAEEKRKEEAEDSSSAPIAVGKLRGEDYNFEFAGKVKEGKMHFRLVMTQAVVDTGEAQPFMRTIDFAFDPDIDTADNLAAEISEMFNLSPTDTEICAAALREWLAKEMPGLAEGVK